MTSADRYPDFEYAAEQLSKFLAASDFFTIMLESGEIVHFTPKDADAFQSWLEKNGVTNMRKEKGWIVNNHPK